MQKLNTAIAAALLASAALWTLPSHAQGGAAKEGSGEVSREAGGEDFKLGGAKPIAVPKVEDEASRDAPDPAKATESLTVLTRSADGKETRTPPSEELKEIIQREFDAPANPKPGPTSGESAADPLYEKDRQVFGQDDRVQVTNTRTYPFTAIGYIEGKTKDGKAGSCSGTLIGPQTVLTAAHCLYSHEQKDWLSDIIFAPGLNGPEDVPFGAYKAASTSILEGFVKNYQGFYGSVVPWDLGIITLDKPVGNDLGWFGFANYDNLGDFDANIVGYPGDKPGGTMWRATCQVVTENIGSDYFQYDCDTYPGSSGSSVYAYDQKTKTRVVTGVNVAESPNANTAVRLNAAYVAWINSLWK